MSHPTTCGRLRPFAIAIAALPLLSGFSLAAKVSCPNGRYVILTGGDLIATTDGLPPTLDLVDRTVTILDGCEIRRGRAKPTKQGVRVSGKFRDCGGVPKLKLKLLIPATCDTVSGTIRGRGVAPATVAGVLSLCGNGVLDPSPAEECDPGVPGVPCQNAGACSPTCRCGGTGGTTTTTLPGGGGGVTVNVVDAFCTTTACTCGALSGVDYHLQATGTASGPVGTELRVNVSALQGGQLDCGGWSPIDASVNPACTAIKCCRRETGQPETSNWAATEAIDLSCYCPSASPTPFHNYLGQAQLPPAGFPVESEKTTTTCP